jgi:hypothetical protein
MTTVKQDAADRNKFHAGIGKEYPLSVKSAKI